MQTSFDVFLEMTSGIHYPVCRLDLAIVEATGGNDGFDLPVEMLAT